MRLTRHTPTRAPVCLQVILKLQILHLWSKVGIFRLVSKLSKHQSLGKSLLAQRHPMCWYSFFKRPNQTPFKSPECTSKRWTDFTLKSIVLLRQALPTVSNSLALSARKVAEWWLVPGWWDKEGDHSVWQRWQPQDWQTGVQGKALILQKYQTRLKINFFKVRANIPRPLRPCSAHIWAQSLRTRAQSYLMT